MEHVSVFYEKGSFAAWPANNGAWAWDGEELLVGFVRGAFVKKPVMHNIEPPYERMLCRSVDGGATWRVERPDGFGGDEPLGNLPAPVDFTAPGFAVRVVGDHYHGCAQPRGAFFVSDDRGRRWRGPFAFKGLEGAAELGDMILTPRTDYVVEGASQCLVMLSAQHESLRDRVFCARTRDGGISFRFESWVVGMDEPFRAAMSSTVRMDGGALVAAVRRRAIPEDRCWIDAYASDDGARSWRLRAKIGDTGGNNGNPPALLRLVDGRLCCVYGQRHLRRLVARFSADAGRTWQPEQVVRDDFPSDALPDLGYPRLIQRRDGALVALYYWSTPAMPEQHVEATIWQPD